MTSRTVRCCSTSCGKRSLNLPKSCSRTAKSLAIAASVEGEVVPDEHVTDADQRHRIESEIGDILFVVANIARRWGVNPEEALRASNRKFIGRVQFIESELARNGRRLADASLAEQEAIYQRKKRLERGERDDR